MQLVIFASWEPLGLTRRTTTQEGSAHPDTTVPRGHPLQNPALPASSATPRETQILRIAGFVQQVATLAPFLLFEPQTAMAAVIFPRISV